MNKLKVGQGIRDMRKESKQEQQEKQLRNVDREKYGMIGRMIMEGKGKDITT